MAPTEWWQVDLFQYDLPLLPKTRYQFSFDMRADAPGQVTIIGSDSSQRVQFGTAWKRQEFTFTTGGEKFKSRVSISGFPLRTGQYWIANLSLNQIP